MTRLHPKYQRGYFDGYDLSGFSRSIGALDWNFDQELDTAWTDGSKNSLNGKGNISAGTYSAFLDNTATNGAHVVLKDVATHDVMIAMGAGAEPAQGDNVFAWKFEQTNYTAEDGGGFMVVSIPLGQASYSSTLTYCKPWGRLLHAKSAETAVNTAVGIDDNGASSALGGIFAYHLFTSNGTVTLKAQDADTNLDGSFGDLSGATSGSIDASSTPAHGMIALGVTATVKRYLRWQLVFGTATSATFVSALIRGA